MDVEFLGGIGSQANSLHDQGSNELHANLDWIADDGTRVYLSDFAKTKSLYPIFLVTTT